jgi:hypothetical protein
LLVPSREQTIRSLRSLPLPELMKRVGCRALRMPDGTEILADPHDKLFKQRSTQPLIDEECDPGDCTPGSDEISYDAGLASVDVWMPAPSMPGGQFGTGWPGGRYQGIWFDATTSADWYPASDHPVNCFSDIGAAGAAAVGMAGYILKNPTFFTSTLYNAAGNAIGEWGSDFPVAAAIEFIGLVFAVGGGAELLIMLGALGLTAIAIYNLLNCYGFVG